MKKYIIPYMLMLLALVHTSRAQQTNSRNYVISRAYKQAGANENNVGLVVTQVQYIDGLGRPIQTVAVGQSPAGLDVVQPAAYDGLGREANQYLPYVSSGSGAYHAAGTSLAASWYSANTASLHPSDLGHPYNETFFEASPLNRPSGQRAPGNKSANASIVYKVNDGSEVKRYDYSTGGVTENGTYGAGTLTRQKTKDEEQHETNVYTDKLGQVVCKKVTASAGEILTTYYVYDNLRQLRAVLQPNYQDTPSLTDYAFTYDYDDQGRVIVKRIPGAGTTEIVYDQYDRPALSRDANQLARNVWGFTKYDALNRPVVTGEMTLAGTRLDLAGTVNTGAQHHENRANSTTEGYSLNLTAPTTATEANLLTVTFYDDYAFAKPGGFTYAAEAGYPASANTAVKSLVTGGRARILPGNGSVGGWLTNVVYYDGEYRPIQTVRDLYDLGAGANERLSTLYKYDLAPVVAQQKTVQQVVGGVTHSHVAENSYDHADRLLQVKETVTIYSGAKTKTAYTLAQRYNTLGQLQSKWFHAYANKPNWYRRKTNYVNNIRGWLTNANSRYLKKQGDPDSTYYGFSLAYDKAGAYTNGNISQMMWRGKADNTFTKGLDFTYDDANRLKSSAGLGGYADTESGISYDKNGNLTALSRSGFATDALVYSYTGNRLNTLSDNSGNGTGVKAGTSSYTYDVNGNMTTDGNRGAILTYNYLNLPKTVAVNGKALTYDYDAVGNKHKYVSDTLTVKYAGIFEYDAGNLLKRIATAEGQLVPSGDTLRFDYSLKDHLGNVRVVFDEKGRTLQLSDYYPFGLSISRDGALPQNARNGINRYLYNEKELQVGTGLVDYGARMYMPEVGRMGSIDGAAEIFDDFSPYSYGLNNPIINIDPSGDTTYSANDLAANWGKFDTNKDNVQLSQATVKGKAQEPGFFQDGGPVHMAFTTMNELNPLAIGVNSIKAFATGTDVNGNSVSNSEAAFNLATILPIGRIGKIGKASFIAAREAQLLLNAAKIHNHHVLPQQFRKWFAKNGINNIDDYAVQISQQVHLKGVHGNGLGNLPGKWNQQWADFIKANPNASASEIFYHAEGLLKRYGLENLPYVPYK